MRVKIIRNKSFDFNLFRCGKCYRRFKKTAFTLAEILIVISIIGIVAESTIPTLKAKVDKQVYVTQLKKFYTTQMEGWSRLLADEGVDKLDDTSVFQRMKSSGCGLSEVNSVNCKPFYDALKKYFRFSAIRSPNYQMTYLNRSKSYTYTGSVILIFSDGSILFNGSFYRSGITAAGRGHMTSMQAQFLYIDINGFKKPNMWGRDIFEFVLSGNGKIYPKNNKDFSLWQTGNLNSTWQNNPTLCGTEGSTDVSSVYGWGCAARIMDEGWQMNY